MPPTVGRAGAHRWGVAARTGGSMGAHPGATRRTRAVRLGLTSAIAVALAGCWPAPGQGPDRRSHNPFETRIGAGNVDSLAVEWTASTGSGDAGPPVVSNRAVHVSDGNKLFSFDRATGDLLWRYHEEDVIFWAADPVADGDRVLFSGGVTRGFGGVWLSEAAWFDARTGGGRDEVPAGPVTGRRGTRLVSWWASGGPEAGFTAYGLDVHDEAQPAAGWDALVSVTFGQTLGWPRPPTLGARHVYLAGPLSRYDGGTTTGVHAFPFTDPATDCQAPPAGLPAVACPTWSAPTHSPPATSPVLAEGEAAAYVVLRDGTLLALATDDGRELWRSDLGAAPSADPALADGLLYVPLVNGDLAVVPEGCGEVTCVPWWTVPLGGAARQPAVANGLVYAGTDAGDLVVAEAGWCLSATCDPVHVEPLGAPVTGAPAVTGGHVYVGTGAEVLSLAPTER